MRLKTFLMSLFAILVIIAVILVVRTLLHPFPKHDQTEQSVNQDFTLSEEAVRRLSGGIRIPTISAEVYSETDFAPFEEFKEYLPQSYPLVYEKLDTLIINEYGLVFHWKGKNPDLRPVLFLSHYDVVPVLGYEQNKYDEEESVFLWDDEMAPRVTEEQTRWEYHPFSGAVARGRVYGRGTLDMKGMLFALMESVNALLEEDFQPERDIWLAFGHDEENGGRRGATQIAAYMQKQGLVFEAVYDEGGLIAAPGTVMKSIEHPLALVGSSEKGFLTLRIKVRAKGGHTSIPPGKSSLVLAAEIIEKLNSRQLPPRISTPVHVFLEQAGGSMNFPARMAIANQWLMSPLLLRMMERKPISNALVRTTTAISMARGSDAPNVLSSTAEVTVNFRLLPGDTLEKIKEHVEGICDGYNVEILTVSEREASSVSPTDTDSFRNIFSSVKPLYPGVVISPYITVGGTDAYKYQIVCDHIYRFMPIELNQYEQGTMHNENEHITLENYRKMIAYFYNLMKIN